MGRNPLRVAIAGGGIGGLAAANALVQRNIDTTVFEQAPELGEVGAGVMMTPNGVRLLERMGLGPRLGELGAPIGEGSQYCRMDGTPVAPLRTTDSDGSSGLYGMHRADLLSLLADALPPGVVRTGSRCVGLDQDNLSVQLIFDDGGSVEADVVVAADGIHSTLQKGVIQPPPPIYSGSVAYRGLVSAEGLPWWPPGIHLIWMGEQKHFMVFPVRGGELLNYVGFLPSEEPAPESWSGTGDPAVLASEFRDWDPRIRKLLSRVETTFWWGLYDREPLPTWTSGRLTLLGDAAHAMLPHLGQGANQSIEDGVALAVMLSDTDRVNAPAALQAYENLRRPRTAQVQLGTRTNGRRYDSEYEDLRQRDAEIADTATLRSWIYDHDVESRATEYTPL